MVVMMSSRMAVLLYLERGVVVLLAAVALLLAIVSFRGQPHTTSNHILALRVFLDSDLPKLLSYFVKRIFSCHFAASCAQSLADLSSYSSHIFTFSLILKNITTTSKFPLPLASCPLRISLLLSNPPTP